LTAINSYSVTALTFFGPSFFSFFTLPPLVALVALTALPLAAALVDFARFTGALIYGLNIKI